MNYWLVKQEPETYSWDDFVKDEGTRWDGVRNYQARNNLREMKVGDRALFYHSGTGKEVVGIAKVSVAAYPDPTIDDDRWVAVDLVPEKELKKHVPLADLRANPNLKELTLLRQSQLSVSSVTKAQFDEIVKMGK
jgi:predicted RNA-binding protein with PUA-like domain